MAKHSGPISFAIKVLGTYQLVKLQDDATFLQTAFCGMFGNFCALLSSGTFNWNDIIDNGARHAEKLAHYPEGTGWKNLVHYAQIINSGRFQRFDYGVKENLKRYGSKTPPEYDLSKIKVKTALYSGDVDKLADPQDVQWLEDPN